MTATTTERRGEHPALETKPLTRSTLQERLYEVSERLHGNEPGPEETADLFHLTEQLVDITEAEATEDYMRYLEIGRREIGMPPETREQLKKAFKGKTILVTGGTGVIGSRLMSFLAELMELDAETETADQAQRERGVDQEEDTSKGRLISISRGVRPKHQHVDPVEYLNCDLRDKEAVMATLEEAGAKPDIIFHVAAQRYPDVAEREVHRTLSTNIIGARTVIELAREMGVQQVVYASTGKALRPLTEDKYAASKQDAESLLLREVQRQEEEGVENPVLYSAARFTHVVNGSNIMDLLDQWIDRGELIRLHDLSAYFYAQSDIESSELCAISTLEAKRGVFNVSTIRDLQIPVFLMNIAIGRMLAKGKIVPILPIGAKPGYEADGQYPYLYDQMPKDRSISDPGEISALINRFEAVDTIPSTSCPENVDTFPLRMGFDSGFDDWTDRLIEECEKGEPDSDAALRNLNSLVSTARLYARLEEVELPVLIRTCKQIERDQARGIKFNNEHLLINRIIQGITSQRLHRLRSDLSRESLIQAA